MANSTVKSAARKAGILDNGYLAQAAIGEGHAVSHGAAEQECILPTGATSSNFAGVSTNGGLAGGTAVAGSDMLDIQWLGRAKMKLKAGQTANRGDFAVFADATGAVKARTLFTQSQYVIGTFAQTRTAGSNDDFIEVDMIPRFVEVVQPIYGTSVTAIGAATKYLVGPGVAAASSTAITLFICPSAGTLRNLVATATTAAGGSDTGIVTVQRSIWNGATYAAMANTTLTATLTAAGATSFFITDSTHTVAVNQGDLIAITVVSSGTTLAGVAASVLFT